jgi:hypothetical protein
MHASTRVSQLIIIHLHRFIQGTKLLMGLLIAAAETIGKIVVSLLNMPALY